MNKFFKLLSVAILSLCAYMTSAQTNDTLEIIRNEKGKIEFYAMVGVCIFTNHFDK